MRFGSVLTEITAGTFQPILVLLILYYRVLDVVKKTFKRTSQDSAKDLNYDRLEAKPLPNGTYE